jgi:hypothetical protein
VDVELAIGLRPLDERRAGGSQPFVGGFDSGHALSRPLAVGCWLLEANSQ